MEFRWHAGRAKSRVADERGRLIFARGRLLDRLALTNALFEQLQVRLDVGIPRIAGPRLIQFLPRPRVIAAQHVGEALIVEDLHRGPDQAHGLA